MMSVATRLTTASILTPNYQMGDKRIITMAVGEYVNVPSLRPRYSLRLRLREYFRDLRDGKFTYSPTAM